MRCNNCGWENPDTNTRCEKCNSPLSGGASSQPAYEVQPQTFNKTVNEAAVFPSSPASGGGRCPQCGYPLGPGVSVCPACHYGATEQEAPQRPFTTPKAAYAPTSEADANPTPTPKQVKASPTLGTVNPWVQVAPVSKCVLEPVAQIGIDTPESLLLKGDVHELNRANLDPDNQTITSRTQAQLTCEDGQWFIEDKSSQHTTFIYAGVKTALKDGDIILMGNRQFIFHIE